MIGISKDRGCILHHSLLVARWLWEQIHLTMGELSVLMEEDTSGSRCPNPYQTL